MSNFTSPPKTLVPHHQQNLTLMNSGSKSFGVYFVVLCSISSCPVDNGRVAGRLDYQFQKPRLGHVGRKGQVLNWGEKKKRLNLLVP
jgi:hypothetical protein